MNSFYTEEELQEIGFCSLGKDVKISRKASIYSPKTISIGNNVRIDDFCILSGNIQLGSNIHISAYVALYGAKGIVMEDFTGISPKSVIYSAMDDFSGEYLVGPIHPEYATNVTGGPVVIKRFVQIGGSSVVFPNIEIGEGSAIGACSLVKNNVEPWSIYYGIPAIKHKYRSMDMKRFVNYERGTYLSEIEVFKSSRGGK